MMAGKLRHRLSLQSQASTPDDAGQRINVWSTYAKRWGEVIPQSGDESLPSGTFKATRAYKVRLRDEPLLQIKHRIIWRGKTLEVQSIENFEGRDREIRVTCIERLSA